MTDIEISVDKKSESTYLVHLLNADAEHESSFHFDLAEKQELRHIKEGISHGDAGSEFTVRLKEYGNKLYNLLLGGAVGEEFGRLSKDGFCLRLHLPRISKCCRGSTSQTKVSFYSKVERTFSYENRH